MFIATFIEEVNFVGSGDSDGWVDQNIRDCYPNDSLMIAFQVFDFSL